MPERSNGKAAGMGIEEKPRLSSETVDEASRGRAKFPPFFEDYDIYLSPTLGKPPVSIGEIDPKIPDWNEYFGIMFDFMPFTSLFNVTGSAGVSLPLWWNDGDLPIGCQFVTRMGRDGLLLQLSAQLERAQPWADRRPQICS